MLTLRFATMLTALALTCPAAGPSVAVTGRVFDPSGRLVSSATVRLTRPDAPGGIEARTDGEGRYTLAASPGSYQAVIEAPGFLAAGRAVTIGEGKALELDLAFDRLSSRAYSIEVAAKTAEPALDLRNSEVFERTLFTRDDQVFQQMNAGINAGQHEGGGKSLEIRRFGFNLDHGGVNGGLKVLVDDVQQNQGTQGHGQGYLGSLKALTPELVEDVAVINGPFSAEYGDFSGLGVVHIRQRESLPDQLTIRVAGGNFDSGRAFMAYSPDVSKTDTYIAYEGSYTNGPFDSPGRYRRDNGSTNYTRTLGSSNEKVGVRLLLSRTDFDSSGQIPLDMVANGRLDRFGYIDPTNGGRNRMGTASVNYTNLVAGGTFKADGFASRSLFDLFSNFTFFLNDPLRGDAFQQHDSRLQHGANAQYSRPHRVGGASAVLLTGANFHDNGINVGLYPREGRVPTGVTLKANAHVTNCAAYAQENVSLWHNRLLLGAGFRFDEFRYRVRNAVAAGESGTLWAGRPQAKASAAITPMISLPLTLHFNYGRGINSIDARAVVARPAEPRLATTDFYQFGAAWNNRRFGLTTDVFLIDHSNEQVYVPDDGSFEFKGPSRAYGYEAKLSLALTRRLSLNGGLTKIGNAYYREEGPRVYVDSAPHFVANAALTLSGWRGFSGSLRMRAINHYRLDGSDPSIGATGHTVFDLSIARRIRRSVEFNLSLDNLTDRDYYETQNYFESRVSPIAAAVSRIHATPGYPVTVVAGLTFRLRGK